MKGGYKIFLVLIFIFLINFSAAARLPVIGSDTDTWGDLLNAFLNISHDASGFLKNINNSVNGITTVDGNLTASGNVSTPMICLNGACQSSWSADSLWTNVSGTATYVGNVNVTQGVYINGYFINSSNYINPIVASGTNSNGSYVKYIDGTMVQWGNVSGTPSSSSSNFFGTSSGTSYYFYSTVTLPIGFTSTNYSVSSQEESNVGYSTSISLKNTTTFRILAIGSYGGSDTIFVNWQAIGKWTNTSYNTSTITVGGGIPSGAIVAYNRTSCPVGWTLADGSSGTPDLRGIFIRGSGTNSILKYANGSYFSSVLGTYGNDSFQGHWHNVTTDEGVNTAGRWSTSGTDRMGYGGGGVLYANAEASAIRTDGTNGVPRTGAETSPAYYSTIYCVKTTEDTDSSNTIWATSGNNVLLNNNSMNVNITSNVTIGNYLTQGYGIIANVTNANGNCLKYADGTMVCYQSYNTGASSSTANYYGTTSGTSYFASNAVDFATAFISNPYLVCGSSGDALCTIIVSPSTTAVTIRTISGASFTGVTTYYIAIGRWK